MLHEKGNIDFENLNFEKEIPKSRRGAGAGYCNSKLANGLFAWELSKQLEDTDVSVFALCPGWVYTGLFRNSRIPWYGYVAMLPIAFLFMRGPKSGAQTILYCATSESLEGRKWGFFRDCKPYESKALQRCGLDTAKKLWDVSAKLVKLVK
ncbi:retinol dehydrogenase 14-like [Artemia franciscana]|uniref:Uncharacterized protein n=1 Tax=Artemia franciscana TaxID=6661 RepID=A0AA88HTG0_ARTSF|nr:hypothetical protein QYM36_011924 [Artemia franciscana]